MLIRDDSIFSPLLSIYDNEQLKVQSLWRMIRLFLFEVWIKRMLVKMQVIFLLKAQRFMKKRFKKFILIRYWKIENVGSKTEFNCFFHNNIFF